MTSTHLSRCQPVRRHVPSRWLAVLLSGAVLAICLSPALAATPSNDTPREQIRLDSGWRFHRGAPPGVDGRLDYDVRPEIAQSADGKVADARPDAAEKIVASRPVLKP